MLRFLRVFRTKSGRKVARLETKTRKYGTVIEQQAVSVKSRVVVFAGAHHSGKTRALQKIHAEAETIYAHQLKPYSLKTKQTDMTDQDRLALTKTFGNNWKWHQPIFIGANQNLTQWVDNDGLCSWWCEKHCASEKDFNKLKQYQKLALIRDYLKETRTVLFVDDAHKFSGKRVQYFKDFFSVASRVIMSCESEQRLPESIRLMVLRKSPEIFQLNTDVSYDMTHVLVWFVLVLLVVAGQYEIALLLGGLKMLASGRGAAKQTA